MARELANFVKDRDIGMFKNGIVFIKCLNCISKEMLQFRFLKEFEEGSGKVLNKNINERYE